MADAKISQLTALTTAADDDLLAIVDTSATETKKIAKSDLVAGLQAELVSGTNIKTINSTSLLGSGDIAIAANPAGTAGQIQFTDGSAFAADSNLFWDNTNKRLGVGTSSPNSSIETTGGVRLSGSGSQAFEFSAASLAQFRAIFGGFSFRSSTGVFISNTDGTPTARLQVRGTGATSATTSLLVQNSSGTELFSVRDDGLMRNSLSGHQFGYSSSGLGIGATSTGLSGATPRIFSSGNDYLYLESGNSTNAIVVVSGGSTHRVGINNGSPDSSAQLDVVSTSRGFLPPRMTTTQKNAISTPASGLIVYDTTTNKLCCYNGTSWNDLF